jgi:hypothetical protein
MRMSVRLGKRSTAFLIGGLVAVVSVLLAIVHWGRHQSREPATTPDGVVFGEVVFSDGSPVLIGRIVFQTPTGESGVAQVREGAFRIDVKGIPRTNLMVAVSDDLLNQRTPTDISPRYSHVHTSGLWIRVDSSGSYQFQRLVVGEPYEQLKGYDGVEISLVGVRGANNALRQLRGARSVEVVWLNMSDANDSSFEYLASLPNLRQLDLDGTRVTGKGLSFLRNLRKLQRLNLEGTDVSDESLLEVSQLRSLVSLNLSGTRVTPKGIQVLKKQLTTCSISARHPSPEKKR